MTRNNQGVFNRKQITALIGAAGALILALAIGGNAFETVDKGDFQVRQRWVSGTMAVKTTPGMWTQFGDVTTFPKSETFFFTSDSEGGAGDASIRIQFADGSWANVAGTSRIVLPTTEKDIIHLVRDLNYESYDAIEEKLTLPTIRRALNSTAKLMTARESYSEKYNEFIFHSIYQIENGLYVTKPVNKKIVDPLSGEEVTTTFQEIQYDSTGTPVTQSNPLEGTGVELQNFEIKGFEYDKVVLEQIAKQQTAMMAVSTKKLEAQEAEQEKLRISAVGKAAVEKARYEKEVEKIEAVTNAEKEKAVAELTAQKELEVAKLAKMAAEQTKQKEILLGQGEAERKRLVMSADGALEKKLAALVEIQKAYAEAFSRRAVPSTYFAGGSNGEGSGGYDSEMLRQLQLMNINTAKQLNLDTTVKGSN